MADIPTERDVRIRLDGTQSQEVLSRAVQQARSIDIYADRESSVILLTGVLVDESDSHLFITIRCENATELAMNALLTLHGELSVDGMVYQLGISELGDVAFGAERLVRIPRPAAICRVERRRSRRYGFRRTQTVRITPGRDGGGDPLLGTLLNLSVNGLACRVANADAVRLATHQTVTAALRTSGSRPTVTLTGRVVSRTPGGSEGFTVIGLEFDDHIDMAQRKRVVEEVTEDDDGLRDQDALS